MGWWPSPLRLAPPPHQVNQVNPLPPHLPSHYLIPSAATAYIVCFVRCKDHMVFGSVEIPRLKFLTHFLSHCKLIGSVLNVLFNLRYSCWLYRCRYFENTRCIVLTKKSFFVISFNYNSIWVRKPGSWTFYLKQVQSFYYCSASHSRFESKIKILGPGEITCMQSTMTREKPMVAIIALSALNNGPHHWPVAVA